MTTPTVKTIPITDLIPDEANANQGTARGMDTLEKSIQRYGHGRSGLVDKNGRIIGGNKFYEKSGELGAEEVILIQSDGKKPIFVQRTDLDINEEDGRMLAYYDNRTAELDLQWYPEQIMADLDAGLPIDDLWYAEELADFFPVDPDEEKEKQKVTDFTFSVVVTCTDEDEMNTLVHQLMEKGFPCETKIQ